MQKYKPKRLPVGHSDFHNIICQKLYFVDKTFFINEIINTSSQAVVITRPRRFGKTLGMSMLYYFFNAHNADYNRVLFNDVQISQDAEAMEHQGKYPTIFLSLKGAKANSYEECVADISAIVRTMYSQHEYLLTSKNLTDDDKKVIHDFLYRKSDTTNLKNSIALLSQYLHKHFYPNDNQKNRIYVLLDEYDAPLQHAYICDDDYYKNLLTFMQAFFNIGLKENVYIFKTVITGITRIAAAKLFSDFNNPAYSSVVDNKYADCFGFTPKEIEIMLKHCLNLDGINSTKTFKEKMTEMQQWYNGYTFGNTHNIYNPWSAIGYLDNEYKPYDYWANTGKPDLITQSLCNSGSKVVRKFQTLVNAEYLIEDVSRYTLMEDLTKDTANLWGLLLHAGYLTALEINNISGNVLNAKIAIPNAEIKIAYYNVMRDAFIHIFSSDTYQDILDQLLDGDADGLCETIAEHLLNSTSFRDWTQKEDYIREFAYHTFINGLLASTTNKRYYISSNKESGHGIYDLCLIPTADYVKIGWVLEFKVAKTEEQLDDKVKEGMQQMFERQYMTELKAYRCQDYICLAIAFYKKQLKYQYKIIQSGKEIQTSEILE